MVNYKHIKFLGDVGKAEFAEEFRSKQAEQEDSA